MAQKRKLHFISDPGHGWLAVTRKELNELGIASQISVYSYQRGETAYLEEDCDAGVYIDALKARGVEFEIRETHQDPTPIREYASFRP